MSLVLIKDLNIELTVLLIDNSFIKKFNFQCSTITLHLMMAPFVLHW